MTGGTAVFCDQFEAVFDVVVDGVGRKLLGWNGLEAEVPPVPEQPNPSRAFAWGRPLQIDGAAPLVQAKLFGLQRGFQTTIQDRFSVDREHG